MTSYPHRHSTRLQGYDYSLAGAYAVTLPIEGRLPLLGTISQGEMTRSPAGEMVATAWTSLEHSCGVEIGAFVVMPNHVHGIVMILEVVGEHSDEGGRRRGSVPTGVMSLSTVMQRFKTFTVHEYGKGVVASGWARYAGRLWQQRFYEHVIRNERELGAMREYILNNPRQWQLDREHPACRGAN